MKIKLYVISFLCLIQTTLLAQNNNVKYSKLFYTYYYPGPFSIVVGAGTAAYRGNLCGRPECNTFKPAFNIGILYKIWPHIAFGGELNYLKLNATTPKGFETTMFSSDVLECRAIGHFYLNDDKIRKFSDKKKNQKPLKLYILLGISGIYYSTVNQKSFQKGFNFSTNRKGLTLGIPVGGGMQYSISPKFKVVGEISYLTSFTDRLDNADGEGSSFLRFLDSYGLILLKLHYCPFVKAK